MGNRSGPGIVNPKVQQKKRLALIDRVESVGHGRKGRLLTEQYRVPSQSREKIWYDVAYVDRQVKVQKPYFTCNCAWGTHRTWEPGNNLGKSACAHALAVAEYRERENARRLSVWTDKRNAKRQNRPTLEIGDNVILTSRVEKYG